MGRVVIHKTAVGTGDGEVFRASRHFKVTISIRNVITTGHVLATAFDDSSTRDVGTISDFRLAARHHHTLHMVGRSDVCWRYVIPAIVGERRAVVGLRGTVGRDGGGACGEGERAVGKGRCRVCPSHVIATVGDGPIRYHHILNGTNGINRACDVHVEQVTVRSQGDITVRTHLVGGAVADHHAAVFRVGSAIVNPAAALGGDGECERRAILDLQGVGIVLHIVVCSDTTREIVAFNAIHVGTHVFDTVVGKCRTTIGQRGNGRIARYGGG